jgi:hypothetical protein
VLRVNQWFNQKENKGLCRRSQPRLSCRHTASPVARRATGTSKCPRRGSRAGAHGLRTPHLVSRSVPFPLPKHQVLPRATTWEALGGVAPPPSCTNEAHFGVLNSTC